MIAASDGSSVVSSHFGLPGNIADALTVMAPGDRGNAEQSDEWAPPHGETPYEPSFRSFSTNSRRRAGRRGSVLRQCAGVQTRVS